MLLTSIGILLVGRHFARRVEIHRTEVNRELITTFAAQLKSQVTEVEQTSLTQLTEAISSLEAADENDGKELLRELPGVRAGYLFRDQRRLKKWELLGSVNDPSLPDLAIEGDQPPFNPNTAIFLSKKFFQDTQFGTSGWIESQDKNHRLFWSSATQGQITALILSTQKWRDHLVSRLRDASQEFFEPIRQSGDHVNLEVQAGSLIFGKPTPAFLGPPSMVTSVEFMNDRLWLRAWNGREEIITFDWTAMLTAGAISLTLALTGVLLYQAQTRAWHESTERVTFVNRVSHELGTPLTNMTLNLELAARTLRSEPEAAGQRLEKVREEVGRLGRLVSNVLSYSRADHQEHLVTCSPDEVIGDVLSQFRPALQRRDIEISWKPNAPNPATLDKDALSQIVWNLISNVEKYAAKGKWLGITTMQSKDSLRIEISDRGDGIPASERKRVFRAFERVSDSTSEGVSGTGLGLTISRDLAQAMGGKLEILDPDQGSAFCLTLPLHPA